MSTPLTPRQRRRAITTKAAASVSTSLALLLAGCASTGPGTTTPADQLLQQAGVPTTLPVGAGATADLPPTAWRGWVREPRLVAWVELALQNNRDLRRQKRSVHWQLLVQ